MAKKRRSSQFKDSSQVIDIEEARRKRQEKRNKHNRTAKAAVGMHTNKPVRASIKHNRRRRAIIYAAIIGCIIAVVGFSVFNIVSLKQEQKDIKQQQEELKALKEEKEQELRHINDPDYIEQQARSQLRLVLPGEKIYVFPSVEKSDKDGGKDTADED